MGSARRNQSFLHFPEEIRDQIYIECLVVEKIYPYASQERLAWRGISDGLLPQEIGRESASVSQPESADAPSSAPTDAPSEALPTAPPTASNAGLNMNILLANKKVYHEASSILFSRNTFEMPTWAFMSRFFGIYAGRDQLNRIEKIELAFTSLDPFDAPQNPAINQTLSAQKRDILVVKFPLARTGVFKWLAPAFERGDPSLDVLRIGRQDVLTAWLRKAMLAKSLESCKSILLRLNEAEYAFSRLDENALWQFLMPPNPTLKPEGWIPSLPTGIRVEGLHRDKSLETALNNIQSYELHGIPLN